MTQSPVLIVAMREVVERGRSKAFLVSTTFTLLVVGAIIIVPTFFDRDDVTTWRVGTIGATGRDAITDIEGLTDEHTVIVHLSLPSVAEAKVALENDTVDIVIGADAELLVTPRSDRALVALATFAVDTRTRADALKALGLSDEEIASIGETSPAVNVVGESVDDDTPNDLIAVIGTLLLFTSIMIYGQWVLTGVVEEKLNRVIEVVLGAVQPRQLLAGKVLGIGGLAVMQLLVILTEGFILLSVFNPDQLPTTSLGAAAMVVMWFVLGFSLYATAYAAAGSLVDRMEDAQNAAFPLTMVLMAGYFIATFSFDSDNPILRAASLFPAFSPMTMPLRQARGDVTGFEVALSVGLIMLAIWLVIELAGRIYTGAALRTGGKVKAREAWSSSDL